MRPKTFTISISFTILLSLNCGIANAQSVQLDTLVDIGGYKIHFNILEG